MQTGVEGMAPIRRVMLSCTFFLWWKNKGNGSFFLSVDKKTTLDKVATVKTSVSEDKLHCKLLLPYQ